MSVTLQLLNAGSGFTLELAEFLEGEFDCDVVIEKSKLGKIMKTYESKIALESKEASATIIAKYNKQDEVVEISATILVEDPDSDHAQEIVDAIVGFDIFEEERDTVVLDCI